MKNFFFSTFFLIVLFFSSAKSDDLSRLIGKATSVYAQHYLQPLANSFGANLNSGLFHSAKVNPARPFSVDLYAGLQAFGSFVPDGDKKFSVSFVDTQRFIGPPIAPYDLRMPVTFTVTDAPTVFGETNNGSFVSSIDTMFSYNGQTIHIKESDTLNTILPAISTTIVPFFVPQIGVGSVFGTDLLVRYLPLLKIPNYGEIRAWGVGVRHNISQYLDMLPFDISAQFVLQGMAIKDTSDNNMLDISMFSANIEISKTLALVTLYGGLQTESSSFDVNYTFQPGPYPGNTNPKPIPFSLNLKGSNTFRGLIGLNINLGLLNLNADYSVGKINVATAGLGIAF